MTNSKNDADNHSHYGHSLANPHYTLEFEYEMREIKTHGSVMGSHCF